MKIKRYCKLCNKSFKVWSYTIRNGHGIFCGNKCHSKSMIGQKLNENQLRALAIGQQKGKVSKTKGTHIHSEEQKKKWSDTRKGKKHYNWRGGISKFPYLFNFNDELKNEIKERDNYICQNCKITEEEHITVFGRVLPIHHIDYDKKNNNKNNLITVCIACNVRANYNRNYWIKFFKKIINNILLKGNKT